MRLASDLWWRRVQKRCHYLYHSYQLHEGVSLCATQINQINDQIYVLALAYTCPNPATNHFAGKPVLPSQTRTATKFFSHFRSLQIKHQKKCGCCWNNRLPPIIPSPFETRFRNVQRSRFPDLCLHERRRRSGGPPVSFFVVHRNRPIDRSITDLVICSSKLNVMYYIIFIVVWCSWYIRIWVHMMFCSHIWWLESKPFRWNRCV